MIEIKTPLKKTETGYEVATQGEDVVGYFAGRVNDSEFVLMVPAGHGAVYVSEPIELLKIALEAENV